MENNIIIAIDLGTSRSRVVAGIPAPEMPYGLNILYSGEMKSLGIRRGSIFNKDEAGKVLNNLLSAAEKKSPKKKPQSSTVLVNIGGMNFNSYIGHAVEPLNGQPVTPETLRRAESSARSEMNACMRDDESLLRTTVIGYSIDNEPFCEPNDDEILKRSGDDLDAKYLFICGKRKAIAAINSAFPMKAAPKSIYPTASSKAAVLLSPAQMKNGVVLVDLGGGTTSVAVFLRNSLLYEMTIPIGSDTITRDIAAGLEISMSGAEEIKCRIGMVKDGDSSRIYKVKLQSGETVEFSGAKLNFIIKARAEELSAYVEEAMKEAYRRSCPNNIKLAVTGGGSRLNGIKRIISERTHLTLTNTSAISADNVAPDQAADFACAIGMASLWVRENKETAKEPSTLPFPDDTEDEQHAAAQPAGDNAQRPQPVTNEKEKRQEPAQTAQQAEPKPKENEKPAKKRGNIFQSLKNELFSMMDDDLNSK